MSSSSGPSFCSRWRRCLHVCRACRPPSRRTVGERISSPMEVPYQRDCSSCWTRWCVLWPDGNAFAWRFCCCVTWRRPSVNTPTTLARTTERQRPSWPSSSDWPASGSTTRSPAHTTQAPSMIGGFCRPPSLLSTTHPGRHTRSTAGRTPTNGWPPRALMHAFAPLAWHPLSMPPHPLERWVARQPSTQTSIWTRSRTRSGHRTAPDPRSLCCPPPRPRTAPALLTPLRRRGSASRTFTRS
mmetsp:Transcript_25641/g.64358  ORF Transcript_25641/g.64358 Transcript_25641/m.64358 type:complete len:241 (-) Transcript_25641:12-734(-)